VKLPNSLSLSLSLSLSHLNLSLLSRAIDLQHRMACGVQLGQYCSASSYTASLPMERERESQVHGQGLFFGCLVVFCNSVAPHGVTCSISASPIPGLLFSPLSSAHTRQQFHPVVLLVCIDCLADLNLHPFPKEILRLVHTRSRLASNAYRTYTDSRSFLTFLAESNHAWLGKCHWLSPVPFTLEE